MTSPMTSPDEPDSPALVDYKPRFCAEVVAFMGRGYSLTAFAGEIGVSRATLLRWGEKHSPFARAMERAQARRARLLEDRLLSAKGAAFGAHMQALKTAAPDEWPARSARPVAAAPRGPASKISADVALPDNGRE